jgi:SAM-dependent methyltransferase
MRSIEATARAAYDSIAPVYDRLVDPSAHDGWVGALESLARESGLRGRRALDVACGTGSSFLPLLERGYEVTACDISPRMARQARRRTQGRARVLVADMRTLGVLGRFDLITCLDDALNHLLTPDDVRRALAGMAANLAPHGRLVFDITTVATYRSACTEFVELDERVIVMRDGEASIAHAGDTTRLTVEMFRRTPLGLWRRTTSSHGHRHYPLDQIRGLLREAGLEELAVRGQQRGGRLIAEPDEDRDHKLVVVAGRTGEEGAMRFGP